MNLTKLAIVTFGSAGLLATTMPAWTQGFLEIEEIVVTARKKEESLQDVPISISAFTSETIDRLNIRGTDDIAIFTPGVSYTYGIGRIPGSDRPAVRGMTTIINGAGNASAASTFIDGVYVSGTTQITSIGNLERIEVLKGPQAAQFGRGTYAGAINYVTKRPSEEFEGGVKLSGAEHDTYDLSAWVSGPISDNAFFYLGAGHQEYGGEYTNTVDGRTVGDEETQSVTGKLYFTLSDNFDLTLTVGAEQTDDGHFASALIPNTALNCCFRDVDPASAAFAPRARGYFQGEAPSFDTVALWTDRFDGTSAGPAGIRIDRVFGSAKANWEFGDGYTVTAVVGTSKDEVEDALDVSYAAHDPIPFSPGGIGSFLRNQGQDLEDISGELRISSPADQPFRWTTGVYYYDGEQTDTVNNRVTPGGFNIFFIPGGQVLPNGNLTTDDVDNKAIFGGVEWDVTDQIRATLEARWSLDDISIVTRNQAGSVLASFDNKFRSFTPRFTLSYAPDDDKNFYVNVSKGTKPGTFNAQIPTDPFTMMPDESFRNVDEETATMVEFGMKAKLQGGRSNLNVALYRVDVSDQQFTTVIELATGSTASILSNVGETEVTGIEIDYMLLLSEYLQFTGTYAWTDSEITSHISSDQADLLGSTGTFADIQRLGSVAGHQTPRVPEHMASLFLRYERPLSGDRMFYASGTVAYEDSRFAQIHNLLETGSRTITGATFGMEFGDWDVNIWAKNLFDDDAPIDTIRYIDRRCGNNPACGLDGFNFLPSLDPDPVTGAPNSAGASSSPRGFVLSLPRGRQIGVSANWRF